MRYDIATPICKVCMKDIKDENIGSLIDGSGEICNKCFSLLNPIYEKFKINGVKGRFLYRYTELAKTVIYQYKGCFDYELHTIFLAKQKDYLKLKYRNWIIIPAPSYKEKDKARGFNHVEEMFSVLDIPIIKAIKKIKDVKQADLSKEQRKNINQYLKWDEEVDITGKKILFVDDILTTGSTTKAAIQLIKEHGPERLEILIGFHTVSTEKLSIFERIKRSLIAYDLS